MPINPTTLKSLIDTQITNETVNFAITPAEVGGRMKDTIDYTTEQIALAEVLTNKSTNVTTDGASDTKYPSVKAVKTYVDANAGGVAKTSGAINLTATFQVLPYDINSCSFSGGKAFLPTTTENGKEIIVLAVANNIEIRANSAGTNFMFVKFQTFVSSVTLATNELYRFTYIGFGGYWKAEILEGYTTENIANKSTNVSLGTSDTLYPTQNAVKTYVDANTGGLPYTFWRAIINKTSVVRVLHDGIGFTSPTISNPFNGVVYVTKTGFFTSLDPNKLEFLSTNLDNSGAVFVTLANQSDGVNPNNEFQVNIFDMAGGQTGTPNGNVTVEIRIYA